MTRKSRYSEGLVKGLVIRPSGLYQFRIDIPKDLRPILGKGIVKQGLGYDKAECTGKAIVLRDRWKRIFWDLRHTKTTQQSSSASAVQLLEDHGIPARQLVGDEVFTSIPESFEALTRPYETYEELPTILKDAADILKGVRSVTISSATKRYIAETGKGDVQLAVDQWIEQIGDMDLSFVRREHVYAYRAYLVSRDNSSETQRKRLGALSRIFSFAEAEFSLNLSNPFKRVRLQETKETKVREPFSDEEYNKLIDECIENGDERRVALAVIAITGARMSEITSLQKKDVHIDLSAIDIYENLDRSLKTKNSRRSVPIVDPKIMKLLAKYAKLAKKADDPVFPSVYGKEKANSVSALMIKFIRTRLGGAHMVHELRHTVATKLKQILTPESILSELLGWKTGGMIGTYGGQLELETKRKWLKKALNK